MSLLDGFFWLSGYLLWVFAIVTAILHRREVWAEVKRCFQQRRAG